MNTGGPAGRISTSLNLGSALDLNCSFGYARLDEGNCATGHLGSRFVGVTVFPSATIPGARTHLSAFAGQQFNTCSGWDSSQDILGLGLGIEIPWNDRFFTDLVLSYFNAGSELLRGTTVTAGLHLSGRTVLTMEWSYHDNWADKIADWQARAGLVRIFGNPVSVQ